MTDGISIDEIARDIGSVATSEIPEGAPTSATSDIYEILKQNPGKYINSSMITEAFKEHNRPTKYLSNKLNQLGKRDDIEVTKQDGRNFYRFVGEQNASADE